MSASSPWKPFAIGSLVVLLIMGIMPLVWPLPPSSGTQDAHALADPDSTFVTVDGLELHVKTAGSAEPAVVLLHSGAQDVFTWREVMGPLSATHRVAAYDRTGYGLSARPTQWPGASPYGAAFQVELLVKLLDTLKLDRVVLMGHAAGATLALAVAQKYPARVAGLVLVAPGFSSSMEQGMGFFSRLLLGSPYGERLGPAILERQLNVRGKDLFSQFWNEPKNLTPEILDGYRKTTQIKGWAQALYNLALSAEPLDVQSHLADVKVPVLVVGGDKDRFVTAGDNDALAHALPKATAVTLKDCGHVVHEECAPAFNAEAAKFLTTLGAP